MSIEEQLKRQNELLEEQNRLIKAQMKADERRAAESVEAARRAKYERLKAEGRLSMKDAIGRGMPTVPTYGEWDGNSYEEQQAERDYWANDRR